MNVEAIPLELKERRQWVVWRSEERAGKPTKVPYRADGRGRASVADSTSWASFEEAVAADATRIGFVFCEADPFCGVDVDDVINGGTLARFGRAIVQHLDSYTERSPSGTGLHVIVRATLNGASNRRGRVEMYDRRRFFCVTGDHLHSTPALPLARQAELDELHANLFPPAPVVHAPVVRDSVDADDGELLRRMFNGRHGSDLERLWNGDASAYASRSEADLRLCSALVFWTGGDPDRIDRLFRSSGLMREKWERADYRNRTLGRALGS